VNHSKDQFIYCFTNPSFKSRSEGYERVKIGKTDNIPRRKKELFSTGVSEPFEVYRALVVLNMDKMEKRIHKLLFEYRVNKQREFFDIPLSKIDDLFDLLLDFPEVEEYVEEDNKEEFESKQSNFNTDISLYDIGCLEGEIVDMYGQHLKVVNSKESLVEYDGKPHALSSAATDLAIKNGGSGRRSGWYVGRWNGKLLWKYKKEHNVKVETE
tara:strand:+ start:319 stop:954 length:636 start_codon:yes stop_codon:yes gene_type:complete